MKRVVITRPRTQAGDFAWQLRQAGFEPVFFPVIEIHPVEDTTRLDSALTSLESYDWLVLTSVNGVLAVWDRLAALKIPSLPENLAVAAIGPKTAEALKARGIRPSFVPQEYIAEAILPGLGDLRGRSVLLPRAELARKALAEAIVQAGGWAHEVTAYHTLPVEADPLALAALRQGVEAVTLTSSSTADNFAAIVRAAGLDPANLPGNPLFACIGPITAASAREAGLPVDIVASTYTTAGLLEALVSICGSSQTLSGGAG
jgi:uroporphyrinogen-III synthase